MEKPDVDRGSSGNGLGNGDCERIVANDFFFCYLRFLRHEGYLGVLGAFVKSLHGPGRSASSQFNTDGWDELLGRDVMPESGPELVTFSMKSTDRIPFPKVMPDRCGAFL